MPFAESYGLGRGMTVFGGATLALFWIMVVPFSSFAGAEAVLNPLQLAAQAFHLASCPALVIGLATFVRLRMTPGLLADTAVTSTAVGLFGFFGDGVIGAVVNPSLATAAPETIAATGAMFSGWVVTYYVATFAVLMVGMLLLAWTLLRAGVTHRLVVGGLAMGAILMNLPPIPGWHLLQVAGGVAAGLAFVAMALSWGEHQQVRGV